MIYNQFHNIFRLFDVLLIFVSPQVKRWAIIPYKHGIYELAYEFLNDLRLTKLGNIRKLSKPHRMKVQCPVSLPKWKFCQYQHRTFGKQKLLFCMLCTTIASRVHGYCLQCCRLLLTKMFWTLEKNDFALCIHG